MLSFKVSKSNKKVIFEKHFYDFIFFLHKLLFLATFELHKNIS